MAHWFQIALSTIMMARILDVMLEFDNRGTGWFYPAVKLAPAIVIEDCTRGTLRSEIW